MIMPRYQCAVGNAINLPNATLSSHYSALNLTNKLLTHERSISQLWNLVLPSIVRRLRRSLVSIASG